MVFFLLLDYDLLEDRRPEPPYPRTAPELFDREDEDIRGALSSAISSSLSLSLFAVLGRRLTFSLETNGF